MSDKSESESKDTAAASEPVVPQRPSTPAPSGPSGRRRRSAAAASGGPSPASTPGTLSQRDVKQQEVLRRNLNPELLGLRVPGDPFFDLLPIINEALDAAGVNVQGRSIEARLRGLKGDAKASFILVDDAKGSSTDLLWATPIKYMLMGRYYGLVVMCIGGRVHDARQYNLLGSAQSESDIMSEAREKFGGESEDANRKTVLWVAKRRNFQHMRETLKLKTNCKWLTVHDLFDDIALAAGGKLPKVNTVSNRAQLRKEIWELLYFEGEFIKEQDDYGKVTYTYEEVEETKEEFSWSDEVRARLEFVVNVALRLLQWHAHAVGQTKLKAVENAWYELTTDLMHKKARTREGTKQSTNAKDSYSSEAKESGDRMTIAKLAVACVWGAGLAPSTPASVAAYAAAIAARLDAHAAAEEVLRDPPDGRFYFKTGMFVHDIADDSDPAAYKFNATMEKWLISRLVDIGPPDALTRKPCKGTGKVGEALTYRLFSLLTAFIAGDAQGVDLWQSLVSAKRTMTKDEGGVGHVDFTAAGLEFNRDASVAGNFKKREGGAEAGGAGGAGAGGAMVTDMVPEPEYEVIVRTAKKKTRVPGPTKNTRVPGSFVRKLSLHRIRLQF